MTERRTALVTGGAQGIGREIARRLSCDGLQVVVADLDGEAVAETNEETTPFCHAVAADVSDESAVRELFLQIEERYGRLDILVNNAAIAAPTNAPVDRLGLDDWDQIIRTNLTGPFLCVRSAAPLLKKAKGTIVNIASTRALQSEPHTEAYAASKGGLLALTHALAISLGPDIRVNCISPGWIAVSHLQKRAKREPLALSDADHGQHPAGRVGRPEDIAAMVAFLASPDAGFITGQNFVVDGGMTRKMIYLD